MECTAHHCFGKSLSWLCELANSEQTGLFSPLEEKDSPQRRLFNRDHGCSHLEHKGGGGGATAPAAPAPSEAPTARALILGAGIRIMTPLLICWVTSCSPGRLQETALLRSEPWAVCQVCKTLLESIFGVLTP